MTPLREAAQQALEALEGGGDSWHLIGPAIDALKAALEQYDKDRVWIEERKASWAKDRELVRANAAEESARIAKAAEEGKCWACGVLKQPERHVSYVCPQCHWSLEQPEQEPVAWMHRHIEDNVITHRPADLARHPDRWTPLYKNPTPCETCQALARTVMMDQTAHDTHPLRREWRGLTEEEREAAIRWAIDLDNTQFSRTVARAVEAKLKELNT